MLCNGIGGDIVAGRVLCDGIGGDIVAGREWCRSIGGAGDGGIGARPDVPSRVGVDVLRWVA